MTEEAACEARERPAPGLTACRLCAGETLGDADARDGGQLARLRELEARGVARLTLSDCLDECERGDVVVVRPSPSPRPSTRATPSTRAARPVWFERLAGDDVTRDLAQWLADGGPGVRDAPRSLRALEIRRADREVG